MPTFHDKGTQTEPVEPLQRKTLSRDGTHIRLRSPLKKTTDDFTNRLPTCNLKACGDCQKPLGGYPSREGNSLKRKQPAEASDIKHEKRDPDGYSVTKKVKLTAEMIRARAMLDDLWEKQY